MTTTSARIASQISDMTRRLQAVERGPQLGNSSVVIDGEDVFVVDALAAGLAAEVAAADAIAAASSAEAKADGAVVTFYGDASDRSTAKVGDFWVNDLGHSFVYSGTDWEAVTVPGVDDALAAARSAEAAVDGKITTFFGPSAPTAEAVGDLWFDTDNGNLLTRWNGTSWVPARDAGVAQALSDAANAQQAADEASTAAVQAAAAAASVQAIADDAKSRADAAVQAANDAAAQAEAAEASAQAVSGDVADAQQAADDANTAAQAALTAAQSAAQQSDLTSVQKAATDAQNAANTAKSAADSAGTAASAADARAAQAAADAAKAISDAASASSAASTAQGTANTAKTNAASAQSTADAAKASAATAQSSADSAKARADQAVTNAATAQAAADAAKSNAATAQSAADAANAQALSAAGIANGKGKVYYQTATPAGDANGLWIKTDEGNKPYRWNGSSWVAVQDAAIAAAASSAASAQTTANTANNAAATAQAAANSAAAAAAAAQTAANNAQNTANSALTTANGKGKVWFQSTAPTASSTYDLWFDTANDNRLWKWDGSNWVNFGLGDAALSSITVGKLVTGTLQAGTRIIAGRDGLGRIQLDAGGIGGWNDSNVQTLGYNAPLGTLYMTGEIRGNSVVSGMLTAQGDGNQKIQISSGSSNALFFYSGDSQEDYPGLFWADTDALGAFLQLRPPRMGAANESLVPRIRMYGGAPLRTKQILIDASLTTFEGDTGTNGKVAVGNDTEFGSTGPRGAPLLIGNASGTTTTSRRVTIDRRKIQAWADIYPDNLYLNHYGSPVIVNGRMIIGAEGTNVSGSENVNLFYAASGSFRIGLSSSGIAYIQTQTGAAFRPIYASAFTVQSEGRLKEKIEALPFSGLASLRNAPSRKWKRQSEPEYAVEETTYDKDTGKHGEVWGTKKRREQDITQYGPLLEDLPEDLHRDMDTGHPDLAGAKGYDLVSLVGVLWEAVRELDAELDTLRAANKVAKPKRKA